MAFQTDRASLPVPKVFAYCSEANPVGVKWVLMEYMPGVELGEAWEALDYDKRARFALDLVEMYDQLSPKSTLLWRRLPWYSIPASSL